MDSRTKPAYERVDIDEGIQLRCLLTRGCPFRTRVWWTDDGSAQEELYRHKWSKHEPETEAPQK